MSSDTEDRLSIFISTNNQKRFGPPLHVHHNFDDFFCVLEGSFMFQLDDKIIKLDTGDSVFIPRNMKHCFSYEGATSGTLLVGITPAKGMEMFFSDMGKSLNAQSIPDMVSMLSVCKKYKSEILGPPMK